MNEDIIQLMEWRWFKANEIKELEAHLASGGIAVHQSDKSGKERATLRASTVEATMKAGTVLELSNRWLHRKPFPHFELKGDPLRKAKRTCRVVSG